MKDVDPVDAEIVEPMSEKDAQRITQRIRLASDNARRSLTNLADLLEQAKAGAADKALGYQSWSEYLVDVFSEEPLRLPRDQRQVIVGYLSGEGLSTRAIGKVVAVDQKTVVNDLRATREEISSPDQEGAPAPERTTERTGEGSSPARVEDLPRETAPTTPDGTRSAVVRRTEGLDGKSYPRQRRPKAATDPKSQGRNEGRRPDLAGPVFRDLIKCSTSVRGYSLADLAVCVRADKLRVGADQLWDLVSWLDEDAEMAQKSEAPVDAPGGAVPPTSSEDTVLIVLNQDGTQEPGSEEREL